LSNGTFSGTAFNITPTITSVGDGWYRCAIYSSNLGQGIQLSYWITARNANSTANYAGDGTSGILIWGAQLVEGASALDYQMTETRLNIPRFDYSLGSCQNILLEPQRTNLNLWSEDLTNVYWSKFQSSIVANATTAPNGLLTADKLVEDTTTNAHSVFIGGLILTIGQSLTRSVYLKADGRNWAALAIAESGTFHRAYFNLSNGTIGNVGAGVTAAIEPAANGFYKCSITRVLTTTNPSSFAIELASANGTNTYLGNGTSGIFVWGGQIEVGAYQTSYIPTSSASVTRNADVISRGNVFTNGLITASGGTWFVDLRNNIVRRRDGLNGSDLFLSTTTTGFSGSNFLIANWVQSTRLQIIKYINGSSTVLYTTTADTAKIAIKWNGATADIFENGVKVVTATAFTATNMQNLQANTFDVPKYINSMALFPTPLTDTQCIALTT
jgi:hypothetical protein